MGFLSILGKVAGGLLGLGNVVGKQQEGAAKGQATQAQLQQGQDRNAIDLYQAQQQAQNQAANTDLQRKQFETANRGTTAKQALLASLLGGDYQPSSVSVPGVKNAQMSGGFLDSLKHSAGGQAAMQQLMQQASAAQTSPLAFQGGQMVGAPSLTALPQASKGNSFLNILSRIAQIGGAVGAGLPKKNPYEQMGPE